MLKSGCTTKMGTFLLHWKDLIFVLTIYVYIPYSFIEKECKLLPSWAKCIWFEQFLLYVYIRKIILHSFIWVCFSGSKTDKYKLAIIFNNYEEETLILTNMLLIFQLQSKTLSTFPNGYVILSQWMLSWVDIANIFFNA